MKRPTAETIKKIDYIIQGLEDGRFTEISKAVEFHQKLKGNDEPTYFTDLLNELQLVRQDMMDLEQRINSLEDLVPRIVELESMVGNYNQDMRGVANALLRITYPDPLGQNYNINIDEAAAENFVNDFKQKY